MTAIEERILQNQIAIMHAIGLIGGVPCSSAEQIDATLLLIDDARKRRREPPPPPDTRGTSRRDGWNPVDQPPDVDHKLR